MEGGVGGSVREGGARGALAPTGGTMVRRGMMFLLAHSVFLAVAVSLFGAD
jgi:hypothetical protein